MMAVVCRIHSVSNFQLDETNNFVLLIIIII